MSDDLSPYTPAPDVLIAHPQWSRNATIYQINLRQFTPEGTFAAAEAHLPRLAELGVTILWLMPIHEIGRVNRKGGLGSPYAVRDYYSVNEEFGTPDDFRHFVAAAHRQGMYVILDWVANHTAWDNILVTEHPDWYVTNWQGDYMPTPWWDWDDIIDLDYDKPELRAWMTAALVHWVREFDVDGYRCDVAGFVPVDFWEQVRRELDAIKPVFMLAEWENRDLHRAAFDMTYGWTWNETMHHIATGKADAAALKIYYAWNAKAYQRDIMRMLFVSNHDHNAWDGTEFERFGDALEAAVLLSVISEGMPLMYNGQEAGLEKRLEFFDRDPIEWREHPMGEFYRRLFALKKENTALWNAAWGARMLHVPTSDDDHVLAFTRRNDRDHVFCVINLSDRERAVSFGPSAAQTAGATVAGPHHGEFRDFFGGHEVVVDAGTRMQLPPWGYVLLVAEPVAEPV